MDRIFSGLGSFVMTTLFAAAAGWGFVYLGRSATYQAMLILMALGVLGLVVLNQFCVTREFLLFGIGFAAVMSPVKDFTFQEGDSTHYMWVMQSVTFSAFDAVLLIFILFYARGIVSAALKIPKPVLFLIAGYVGAMLLSLSKIGPGGHMEVAETQLLYEARCFMVFAAAFTLMLNPGPGGVMTDLRHILVGLSCAAALETAIVCMEYVGMIQTGPLFMGIRVGSHTEGLEMGEVLRVGGTFQHPNYLGVFAGGAFLLLWQTEMDSRPDAARSLLFWPGIAGAFLCLVLTLSRSGWAGTAAGGMAYVCVMLAGRGRPWLSSLPWKYAIPALVILAGVGLFFSESILGKIFTSNSGNVTSREYMNDMALLMWSENPWLGVGLGQHGFAMSGVARFAELKAGIKTMPAVHNSYLLILSEIGIAGALCYFLIPLYAVASGLLTCLRNPHHRATAVLCGACTAVMVYQVADVASISLRHLTLPLIYWLLLGIILGLSRVVRNGRNAGDEPEGTPL